MQVDGWSSGSDLTDLWHKQDWVLNKGNHSAQPNFCGKSNQGEGGREER